MKESIKLEDGKYEIVTVDNCANGFYALRHGEKWRDLCGDSLVLACFYTIKKLEEENNAAIKLLNILNEVSMEARAIIEGIRSMLEGK